MAVLHMLLDNMRGEKDEQMYSVCEQPDTVSVALLKLYGQTDTWSRFGFTVLFEHVSYCVNTVYNIGKYVHCVWLLIDFFLIPSKEMDIFPSLPAAQQSFSHYKSQHCLWDC